MNLLKQLLNHSIQFILLALLVALLGMFVYSFIMWENHFVWFNEWGILERCYFLVAFIFAQIWLYN